MNQNQVVLSLLKEGRHITSMQAYEELGITRLPSRICDLRKMGYPIGAVWRTCCNRLGHKSKYLEYFLVEIKKEQE